MEALRSYTAFAGTQRIASGDARALLRDVVGYLERAPCGPEPLFFDDDTGSQVEFDLRGSLAEVLARLDDDPEFAPPPPRGPGRPKLGVVSREISLLPRHWAWLDRQPGGASASLRRLVEAASKQNRELEAERRARDAAGKFMWAMAGNLPGFEEASRALYAGQRERLGEEMRCWPADIRAHVERLLSPRALLAE